jgi:hypothetical protein
MNEYDRLKKNQKNLGKESPEYKFFRGLSDFSSAPYKKQADEKVKISGMIFNLKYIQIIKYAAVVLIILGLLLLFPAIHYYKKSVLNSEYSKVIYNQLIYSYYDETDNFKNYSDGNIQIDDNLNE